MDTTTKMLVVGANNKNFAKAMFVLSSIMTNNISLETYEEAQKLEESFTDYWKENNWLRMFANTTEFFWFDEEYLDGIRKEIRSEFLEEEKSE